MEELNKLVNNLSVSYGSYNACKNKKTAATLRKELQKLKAYTTEQRQDVLNSVKPVKPVTPVVVEFVVPPVQPSIKKIKKLKLNKVIQFQLFISQCIMILLKNILTQAV